MNPILTEKVEVEQEFVFFISDDTRMVSKNIDGIEYFIAEPHPLYYPLAGMPEIHIFKTLPDTIRVNEYRFEEFWNEQCSAIARIIEKKVILYQLYSKLEYIKCLNALSDDDLEELRTDYYPGLLESDYYFRWQRRDEEEDDFGL